MRHNATLSAPSFLQLSLRGGDRLPLHTQVLASKRLATYFGTIGIGKSPTTHFKVLFDTASCELWVPDQSCASPACARHTLYRRSVTYRPRRTSDGQPSRLSVEYLSGKVAGRDATETVVVGDGIEVPNQSVGFASTVDVPLLETIEWDGIVGLGFANAEIKQRGVTPLMDTIMKNEILTKLNLANQFSYHLSHDGGQILFGGADLSLKRTPAEEFVWAPVDPSSSYWAVTVLGVRKAQPQDSPSATAPLLDISMDGEKTSIVDTGTYLIYAPKSTDLSDLRVSSCADRGRLPSLMLQIQGLEGNVLELVLTPDDYVLEFRREDGQSECMLGIATDDAGETDDIRGWTLGQVFLRAFYTVFDRSKLMIGFVRAK
ncbi:unnamed protein product [Vitrella brassicaformis CCMP3155]|uniref:Peptidase A1 domain-containing protein n=1 Tax=Vitrella brassicaformis (strain CCMP3155) TaxID=1169540 RepID=A0A0G4GN07_VITBC|nr:unnamed protein product [Vitrella brassicaformis CCMP3155]|eukprot:CEM31597.1 unnamed protein product [Vitrella brassicaformis CCMP3155]